MEINQENIEKVAEVLRMGKFNEALIKSQDLFELAKQLIQEHPDLTADEIGQVYEQQLEMENNNKNQEEGPSLED